MALPGLRRAIVQPVLNVEDVKAVENGLSEQGVSVSELMRRAGGAAADEVMRLESVQSVTILVGFGNNGGDGWVAAQILLQHGYDVTVVSPVEPGEIKSDIARLVAQRAQQAGVAIVIGPPRQDLQKIIADTDLVLDAMLGTGFHGAPKPPFDIWIDTVMASGVPVISIDVPSGLSAQTGHAPGACITADETVTMLCLKPGLISDEGRDVTGGIIVAPLAEQTERTVLDSDPVAWRVEPIDYADVIQPHVSNVDKYSRGSVLVVAGSSRYPGAAVMAAKAAARAGAGYVTLAVPVTIAPLIQMQVPEIPVVGVAAEQDGTFSSAARPTILKLAERNSATLVGPGMRVTAGTVAVVSALMSSEAPLVVDADGLNCLARLTNYQIDDYPEVTRRDAPLILTPHRRELGRLVGLADTPPDSLTAALEAARRIVWADGGSEICVVAKGTATACVNVEAALLPEPGPAALATAGSGDVLGGIISALLARTPKDIEDLPLIASLGCEIHAVAGNRAAKKHGSRGVMATDIIEEIGLAADELEDHVESLLAGDQGEYESDLEADEPEDNAEPLLADDQEE